MALAVLDINTMEPAHVAGGIHGLGIAYQNESENPMVLNHLANHFFYKNVSFCPDSLPLICECPSYIKAILGSRED